ncbi:MAG: hypothetical protein V4585_04830 [Bacteroidota bacterium]|jgi:hypothetical protein
MNTVNLNTSKKSIIMGILTLVILFAFSSCTKKIMFLTSPVVPAARGEVVVKKDKNKNFIIHVHLSELAEVSRLSPPKQTYVVWMVTDQNITRNIGQINSKTGMLSKQLKASFETASSFKPVRVFITAEDDAMILSPGSQVILTTDSF